MRVNDILSDDDDVRRSNFTLNIFQDTFSKCEPDLTIDSFEVVFFLVFPHLSSLFCISVYRKNKDLPAEIITPQLCTESTYMDTKRLKMM